ncbi:alpha/beta-hydrolase [Epithele typhae]|uniref:alpha/beta-hydrolase n=1 Tax=Epithele typhae TaxID=378194 RepID=UPI00200881A0|nr:alpha/beta-hydrolase [Epithele typhae]KAH9941664.1 alpha/beta-hydrolase [Epithele typhae]
MDASKYKDVAVRRGYTYHYYYSRATAGKPTLLFVHGFPSTSFDWSRQVAHFAPLGYGVLVPDCLGFGGTSKPTDLTEFRHKLIADDLVDLVDAEGLDDVVAIGHDWGSALVSALAQHYQDRFRAFAWLAAGYFEPKTQAVDPDVMFHFYGYWELMNAPHGPKLIEDKMDSFLQLNYSVDPGLWKDHLLPRGAFAKWLEADRRPGRPEWLSEEDYNHARNDLLEGGITSPVNYYKIMINKGNLADHQALPEANWHVKKPGLFIATKRDSVCIPDLGKASLAKYAPHAEVIELDAGHWVQLEATKEVNEGLEKWLLNLPSASAQKL